MRALILARGGAAPPVGMRGVSMCCTPLPAVASGCGMWAVPPLAISQTWLVNVHNPPRHPDGTHWWQPHCLGWGEPRGSLWLIGLEEAPRDVEDLERQAANAVEIKPHQSHDGSFA